MTEIKSFKGAVQNILELNDALNRPSDREEAKRLLKSAWNYLVFVSDDGLLFGPSKFVGFANNRVVEHQKLLKERDGRDTDKFLEKIGARKISSGDPEHIALKEALFNYLDKLEVTRHNRALHFYIRDREANLIASFVRGGSIEEHAKRIALSVESTVKHSGKETRAISRRKRSKLSKEQLQQLVVSLYESQSGLCNLTGVKLRLEQHSDLYPSLDRIDSYGDYEFGNLQLVCRFANFWKGARENNEFLELVDLVKRA